jgi:hypothetical protein
MKRNLLQSLCVLILMWPLACLEPGDYRYGTNITGLTWALYNENVGVHPHPDVLLDPNNPFAESGISDEMKWEVEQSGGHAAAFYSWATLLAQRPSGEHQFYAAKRLQGLLRTGEVPGDESDSVRQMAIRGYQALLDYFPDSVTYDATGTIAYRLATLAYQAILELGGVPQGDWVLVTLPNGDVQAVQATTQIGTPEDAL